MKAAITPARCPHRQRGFSVLEILIATVMISALVASGLYFVNLGDKTNLVDLTAAKTAVAVRFPEALVSVYARKQSFVGTTDADLTSTGSVRAGTPFSWTIAGGDDAPTRNILKLSLTFEDAEEAELIKDYLVDNRDSLMVTAAEVSAKDKKVVSVTYGVN